MTATAHFVHPMDARIERAADLAGAPRRAREQEDADWRWLMSEKRGRRIVRRLLELSGNGLDEWNASAAVTSYQLGRTWFAKRLTALLNDACPELVIELLKEQLDDRAAVSRKHKSS